MPLASEVVCWDLLSVDNAVIVLAAYTDNIQIALGEIVCYQLSLAVNYSYLATFDASLSVSPKRIS